MEIKRVLNGNCASGNHSKCPAKSKGSKSDPVTFICICECHVNKAIKK